MSEVRDNESPPQRGVREDQGDFQYDEAYFNRHFSSPAYIRRVARRNRNIRDLTRRLVKSGNLLEIGFGNDNLIRWFSDSFDVYGIDISEFAVKSLGPRYNPMHFRVGDISVEDIPFDAQFDLICAINVIEHVRNPETVLRRIISRLKTNGFFAIHLPTQGNSFSRLQYKLLYDVEEHVYRPSIPELQKLLTDVGFRPRLECAASFLPMGLCVTSRFILHSLNLYFGIWQKP